MYRLETCLGLPLKTITLLGLFGILFTMQSGCAVRYARVIAQSSPQSYVTDKTTGQSFGPTPAYIDVSHRFFVLEHPKHHFSYIFESERCSSLDRTVEVTKWAKSAADGPHFATAITVVLPGCCPCTVK
jgi:hypothetical protein